MRFNGAVAEIRRTRTVAVPPHVIWEILADFGSVSSWADFVDHSCLLEHGARGIAVGTSRRVQLGRGTFVERITDFDPPRLLGYDIEGLPALIRHLRSTWTLRPLGNGHTEISLTNVVTIGTNPIQRLAERVFARVSAKRLDLLLACLTKRLETHHV